MPRRKKGVKIEGAARPGNSTASKVVPNHRYDLRRRLPPFYGKDDLDILLQNNRKGRKKARDSQSGIPSLTAAQTSAKITAELYKPLDSASSDATSEEPTSTVLQQLDPQEAYYRELTPSTNRDRYADKIRKLPSQLPEESKESNEERILQGKVWKEDQQKCSENNEELFQRTLLMTMIDRHRFFFNRRTGARNCYDFSVEKLWNCWPMPTRALENGDDLLPRPKPDLSVCFRTDALIPKSLMGHMPEATRSLVFFEGTEAGQVEKAFPFFTIEAKRSYTYPNNSHALHQSLNNASQALHNMYEFFREAETEEVFFNRIRFFSAATTSKGIIIRIHRAVRLDPEPSDNGYDRILSDYPLQFEYEIFEKADGPDFERQKVVDVFENIIWAYGPVLFGLLRKAAEAIALKFKNNKDLAKQRDHTYYRHGQ